MTAKDKFVTRMRRLAGQIDGIVGMYQKKRSCEEIFQQLSAVRSNLDRTMAGLLKEAICHKMSSPKKEKIGKMFKDIFKIK